MPRGFKRDFGATTARFFADDRSFVALGSGCEVLYGLDASKRRQEIIDRAQGRCEALEHVRGCNGLGEHWHHTKMHDGKRCDCLSAGRWLNWICHLAGEHGNRNPQWTRKGTNNGRK